MKTQRCSFLALAALLASPAVAQDPGTQVRQIKPGQVVRTQRLPDMVGTLGAKARTGQVTADDIAALRAQVAERNKTGAANASPAARIRNARLDRTLADLQLRAQNAKLKEEHIMELQAQILDNQLDRSLDELAERAANGGASREDFNSVQNLLEQRAAMAAQKKAAISAQKQSTIDTQLRAAAADVNGKAKIGPADVKQLRERVVAARLDEALDSLAARSAQGEAQPADFERVKDQLADRSSASGDAQDAVILTQYQAAVDAMQKRAVNAGLSADEIATLRGQLQKRARNATQKNDAPAPGDGSDAGDGGATRGGQTRTPDQRGNGPKPRGDGDKTRGDGGKTRGDGDKTRGDGGKTRGDGDKTRGDGDKTRGDGDKTRGDGGKTRGDGGKTRGDGGKTRGDGGKTRGGGR